MPRVGPSGALPSWDDIYAVAAPQAGYFTGGQAAEAGLSRQLLEYHVGVGHVTRVWRGMFRLTRFPTMSDRDDLVPVWLWSDEEGVISHETALSIHQLSDVLPEQRHISVPAAWRPRRLRGPRGVVVHYADVPKTDRNWEGPIPVTTPIRSVIDCIEDGLSMDLINQAVKQGVRRRLFTKAQVTPALRRRERAT